MRYFRAISCNCSIFNGLFPYLQLVELCSIFHMGLASKLSSQSHSLPFFIVVISIVFNKKIFIHLQRNCSWKKRFLIKLVGSRFVVCLEKDLSQVFVVMYFLQCFLELSKCKMIIKLRIFGDFLLVIFVRKLRRNNFVV